MDIAPAGVLRISAARALLPLVARVRALPSGAWEARVASGVAEVLAVPVVPACPPVADSAAEVAADVVANFTNSNHAPRPTQMRGVS